MLEAFIVTLREGVEAALIVGITLAYLAKIGRPDLRRAVYAGLAAAFVGSIGVAVALSYAHLNQDIFEGWVMLVAAVFVISMMLFMMRTSRKLRGQIESRVGSLVENSSRFGLFAFVFLMVLREGVETVIFLAALALNTTALMNFIGTLAGIALAILFGVTFVKGTIRINLQKFFRVTSFILFFVAIQLVISGLHELSENGVLPSSREEMAVIGPIVRNDLFFFVTILALAALMILLEYRRRAPSPELAATRAERRKAAWSARRERLWMAGVYASSFLFIVLVTAQFIYARSTSALTPAIPVAFAGGAVRIPVSQVSDGDLHRFSAELNGTEIRFWLMRRPDGSIASVFDACEICGPAGFYRSGNGQIICKNCAAPINPQSVGQAGGCNPVPLAATVGGGTVIVTQSELAAGARLFQRR